MTIDKDPGGAPSIKTTGKTITSGPLRDIGALRDQYCDAIIGANNKRTKEGILWEAIMLMARTISENREEIEKLKTSSVDSFLGW